MDLISNILKHITVKNRVTGLLSLRGDWAFESPAADEAVFHCIFKGTACITYRNETVHLKPGDMVMFTKGDGHVLGSAPDAQMVTFAENDTRVRMHDVHAGEVCEVVKDADGEETSIICARFNFSSQTAKDLVEHLSDQVVLRNQNHSSFSALEPVLRAVAAEAHSDDPGALAQLDGLVNLLYMSFMRGWLKEHAPDKSGWIAGLRDPKIAKALQLIHADPGKDWQVTDLASEVGMSRSNFAARFSEVTGVTPVRYLTRWRLIMAANQLETEPSLAISSIALSVGYDSEPSFSTAFKREFGSPPGTWRKDRLNGASADVRSA